MQTLELADFRNYEQALVEFTSGLNLLHGDNGQGKTNLLEAIFMLCALGSHRVAGVAPMVRNGADRAIVRASGLARARKLEVDAEIRLAGGIRARVNRVGVAATQMGASGFASVLFSPEDLELVKGEPEFRRRFLDHVATQIGSLAATERHEFERVLRQRNGALKAAPFRPRAMESLEVWDEQLARTGSALVSNRLEVLDLLAPRARDHLEELAGGGELSLVYRPTWASGPVPDGAESIFAALREGIRSARSKDLERGFSSVGPHRDDLEITIEGNDARTFASQGEQRSVALAMRLAERDAISQVRAEDPILLLDDVFSELDDARQGRLASLIYSAGQTIVTATALERLPVAPRRVLKVENGTVALDE